MLWNNLRTAVFTTKPILARSLFTSRILKQVAQSATSTIQTAEKVTLKDLPEHVHKDVSTAVTRLGFPELTPVQQLSLSPILTTDKDIVAHAKTGTGKTLAFLIPLVDHFLQTRRGKDADMVKAVIIAPTRDLALQIENEYRKLQKKNVALEKFPCVSLIGGASIRMQLKDIKFKRPQLIVATPGRILDVLRNYPTQASRFKGVSFKVLDEADRLLDTGFMEDLVEISRELDQINAFDQQHIRTLLFSATMTPEVTKLAREIMHKEHYFVDTIDPNEPEAHERITQNLHVAKDYHAALSHSLKLISDKASEPDFKAIVFMPTVKMVSMYYNMLSEVLREQGSKIPVYEFHGKLSQARRDITVKKFRTRGGILITSDVGARGMDFPAVSDVYQLYTCGDLENYVHRIGRTARGGRDGTATMIVSETEMSFVRALEKNKKITWASSEKVSGNPEILESIKESRYFEEDELKDTIISMTGYLKGCAGQFRFRTPDIYSDLCSIYDNMYGHKMSVGPGVWKSVLGLRDTDAAEVFDIGYTPAPRRNSDRGFSKPRNNSYQGRGNRDGYRSRDGYRGRDNHSGYRDSPNRRPQRNDRFDGFVRAESGSRYRNRERDD